MFFILSSDFWEICEELDRNSCPIPRLVFIDHMQICYISEGQLDLSFLVSAVICWGKNYVYVYVYVHEWDEKDYKADAVAVLFLLSLNIF